MEKEKILEIRNLDITFKTTAGPVHAIRGVDIDLHKGETVAIVGESGSGKSVTMKAAMGILAKNATVNSGSISFSYTHADGQKDTVEILEKDKKWIRKHINGKRIAMVFQDPMTSLDPTMSIGKQIMEGMLWHFKMKKEEAWKRSCELLQEVGIEDAEKRMRQYPHQLSGGMRQRVVIAIALACNPDLLICDEPTTALDVTIQAKIIDLIRRVQKERGISVIYITHDLGVVAKVADYVNVMYAGKIVEKGRINEIFYDPRHPYTWGMRQRVVIAIALACNPDLLICDEPTTALDVTIQAKILELIMKIQRERGISVIYITHDLGVVAKVADYVNVMYAGKIVEKGTINEIFYDPKHPYTWGLLSAMPDLETDDERLYAIPGSPPNLLHERAGDAFAPRNRYALEIDDKVDPPMFKVTDTHYAATWLLDPRAPKVEMPKELALRIERMKEGAEKYGSKL